MTDRHPESPAVEVQEKPGVISERVGDQRREIGIRNYRLRP